MSGNFAIKGGGVGRLMANAILNFHFDFLHPSLSWFEYFLVNLSRSNICWNKKGRKMKQESDQLLRERTQIVLLWIFALLERVSLKANTNNSAYAQSRAFQSPVLCKKWDCVLQVLASTEIVLPLTSWDAAKSKNVLTRKSAAAT